MNLRTIFKAFPIPTFLSMPYAGLAISDTNIRALQFLRNSRGLYVSKYTERDVPPGVIVSGFINNQDEVVSIIESIRQEMGVRYVRASLPEEKAYLFNTKVPIMPSAKIREAIEFTIEENVPLPASELAFDFATSDMHGHGDHIDVVVSTIPTKIVDLYVDTLEKAGLAPLSLEIESQAMARALLAPRTPKTVIIAHFEKEKVGLYVASQRIVHFTSTVSTKGESLEEPVFLSQEIKKLRTYWDTLKDNVARGNREITEVIFCGEGFPESLPSFIGARNSIAVSLGDVWSNAFDVNETVPPISFQKSLQFVRSIGLALPSSYLV